MVGHGVNNTMPKYFPAFSAVRKHYLPRLVAFTVARSHKTDHLVYPGCRTVMPPQSSESDDLTPGSLHSLLTLIIFSTEEGVVPTVDMCG